jgi:hypothetical protein
MAKKTAVFKNKSGLKPQYSLDPNTKGMFDSKDSQKKFLGFLPVGVFPIEAN